MESLLVGIGVISRLPECLGFGKSIADEINFAACGIFVTQHEGPPSAGTARLVVSHLRQVYNGVPVLSNGSEDENVSRLRRNAFR
jgi:hypothetical protein